MRHIYLWSGMYVVMKRTSASLWSVAFSSASSFDVAVYFIF